MSNSFNVLQEADHGMNDLNQSSSVKCRLIQDENEWDALESNWSALFSSSPQASFPLRYGWLRNWWRIYGPIYGHRRGSLRLITVWRSDRLVGVLPLYSGFAGDPVFGARRLGFVSTGEAEFEETCPDYLNLLALPGEESTCLEAAWNLLGQMRWDCLTLQDVPESSPLLKWEGAVLGNATIQAIPRGKCPIANLGNDFEEYIKQLSQKTRQHARQYLRAADRIGAVLELAGAADADAFFDDLVRLHQQRWTAEGKPGCFSAQRFAEFHRQLARAWVATGDAVLARLSLGGQPIAVLYGFVTGTKFDFYQSGIQRANSGPLVSPGTTANLMLMRTLMDRGVNRYDFLRGSSSYKERLANEERQLFSLLARRATVRTMTSGLSSLIVRGTRRIARTLCRR
jgi:Acetyltransferase (GNAT) domain